MNKLSDYARWVLSQPICAMFVPDEVRRFKLRATEDSPVDHCDIEITVIHRKPPFQVELVTSPPTGKHLKFPEHRHPNVDSIEVMLGGELTFSINGNQLTPDRQALSDAILGKSLEVASHHVLLVRAKDFHGGTVGPDGAAFLSIQKWREGVEMTSVSLDWEGPEHLA